MRVDKMHLPSTARDKKLTRNIALVLKELEIYSNKPIAERLKELPKGIAGIYEHILRRPRGCLAPQKSPATDHYGLASNGSC
jgi:hypothetical protein